MKLIKKLGSILILIISLASLLIALMGFVAGDFGLATQFFIAAILLFAGNYFMIMQYNIFPNQVKKIQTFFAGRNAKKKIMNSIDWNNFDSIINNFKKSIDTNAATLITDDRHAMMQKATNRLCILLSKNELIDQKKIDELEFFFKENEIPLEAIEKSKSSYGTDIIKNKIKEVYAANIVSEADEKSLILMAKYFGINLNTFHDLKRKVVYENVRWLISRLMGYSTLSPQDEGTIYGIFQSKQIQKDQMLRYFTEKEITALRHAKRNWQYQNGILPQHNSWNIFYKPKEIGHLKFAASVEEAILKYSNNYIQPTAGVAVQVTENLSLIGASTKGESPIKQEIMTHRGNIYLTNQRLLFISSEKSFEVNLKDILSYDLRQDGIDINVHEKHYAVILQNSDAVSLNFALTHIMNKLSQIEFTYTTASHDSTVKYPELF